ncbi:MAG: DUF5916 domain-containing protein [Pseudomonadales bacterium]|nr:DUF5916 domain-containing protein [Pseudomonadales bacterium]
MQYRLMLQALNCLSRIAVISHLLLWSQYSIAQGILPQVTRIAESENDFRLDGDLDEAVWNDLPIIDGMQVIDPDTLADAPYETHVRMFYTERGIYIGAMNYQPEDSLVARMTSRDTRLARDGFIVSIDPSGQGLYGYFIRLNLGESMTDGTILPERQFNMQWDGPWNGRTSEVEGGWSAEIYIPWSMMALPQDDDTRTIGFYFERQVGHLNGDTWSNPPLPQTVNEYLSAFTKYELRGIQPSRQLTYYPFIGGVHDDIRHEDTYKIGTDIFWRPTTNTQLTATINPDFGSVQADDVIVNLTAFEQFFPEQRDFFLEGQDIFITHPRHTNPGGPGGPIQLVNTRRIGGAPILDIPDGVDVLPTDRSQPTDLLGAMKFVGQQGKFRYGTLMAFEDEMEVEGIREDGSVVELISEGRDFVVGRALYEDTNSGGRRSIGWMGTSVHHPEIDETVNAIDAHYFSADNRWVIDSSFMRSDKNGEVGYGGMADFRFRPERGKQHTVRATYFDESLDINELGFLTRNDQMNLDYNYNVFESDISWLRSRNTTYIVTNQWNVDGKPVRIGLFLNQDYNFLNNDTFSYSLRVFPERIDDRLGRGTGDFEVPQREGLNLSYESDPAKPLAINVGIDWGTDQLGPQQVTSRAGVAWRPNDRFSSEINLEYTDQEALLIHNGNGSYTSFEAHQWAPNMEVNYFIGPRQQIRFTMQYNGIKAFEDRFWQSSPVGAEPLTPVAKPNTDPDDFVISRMTFQARYRWEIAPLSDLFLVYTRGSNLPRDSFDTYSDLFARTWNQPIINTFAFRLRYRFGA